MARPPLRVLIVDDDPMLGDLFVDVLETHGHTCRVAKTGSEALRFLSHEGFDLVLCDLWMPTMNGRELWERLRESHPQLAETIIFISAEEPETAHARFFQGTGARYRYLKKPFDIHALIRLIEGPSDGPVQR